MGRERMKIAVFGANYKTAPIEIRENLSIGQEKIPVFLRKLNEKHNIFEAIALSTCNRFETYCVGKDDIETSIRSALNLFVTGDVPKKCFYFYHSLDAVRHLISVTSSIDSLVIGESQIISQVKDAYVTAKEAGTAGKYLSFLFQKALKVAKEIRSKTGIARNKVSISSVATDLAKQFFPDLPDRTVLVIGSGKIGKLSLTHLLDAGVKKVLVANRSLARARIIAEKVGGTVVPLENLDSYLATVDIVIGCTSAPSAILHRHRCAPSIAARNGRPIFIIDLGVPRNVDPEVGKLEWVHLYNIDQLEKVVNHNIGRRKEEVAIARRLIDVEAEKIWRQTELIEQDSLISMLVASLEKVRKEELLRLHSKLPDLTAEEAEEIEYATRRVVNRILHKPISVLKSVEHSDKRKQFAEVIERLFVEQK